MIAALTTREVCQRTGLSRCSIWRLCRRSASPQPRQLSPGRRAWLSDDIDVWLASRPAASVPEPVQLKRARAAR